MPRILAVQWVCLVDWCKTLFCRKLSALTDFCSFVDFFNPGAILVGAKNIIIYLAVFP